MLQQQEETRAAFINPDTGDSGASYRNRVELQNGCLALGHVNLFIPSTLNGSCLDNGGKINEKLLCDNLNSAIDVYLSRVDKAPCVGLKFTYTEEQIVPDTNVRMILCLRT